MQSLGRFDRVTLAGGAFLCGIAIHSFQPYRSLGIFVLILAVAGSLGAIVCSSKNLRTAGLVALFLAAGLWRFDVAIPSLPTGLRALDSTGLIHSWTASKPTDVAAVYLQSMRSKLTLQISTALPGDEGALLAGMLYGERGLSKEAKTRFESAGLTHLVAVSGSNITILVVILMRILLGIGLDRRKSFFALAISVMLFVGFVGPQASVVRAAIMGLLIELAPLVGRLVRASRLLLVAAVAFTLVHPAALLFDASFALSFLATIGLLTWGTWFDEYSQKYFPWKTMREIAGATFGATLMTAPYIAWAFGQVSLIGIIANLFAVPLTPWVTISSLGVLLVPSLSWAVLPAKGFLSIILEISRLPERLSFGTWNNVAFSYVLLVTAYALILYFWREVQRENRVIHRNEEEKRLFLS